MYIATNEDLTSRSSIINILPQSLKRYMYTINLDEAEEIRMIQGKPMYIRYPDGDYFITQKGILSRDSKNGLCIQKKHIDEMLEKITRSSLYSVKDEIKNGYVTIKGGHRVGIAGTAVTDRDNVEFIKNISTMTIRIATEIIGVSDCIIGDICDGEILNTLIVSPPGCGKTTLLRDIVRNISNMGYCVAIADERCEVAAMCNGESAFELGDRTAVLENCPKQFAMTTLLRSMSPDVIVTDELGEDKDAQAVAKIINSGVGVIATAHGKNTEQLRKKQVFVELLPMFDVIITLSKRNGAGTIERIEKQC